MRENNELTFGHTRCVLLGHRDGVTSREEEQVSEEGGEERFSVEGAHYPGAMSTLRKVPTMGENEGDLELIAN